MTQDRTTTTTPATGRRRLGAALLAIGAGSTLTSGIAAGVAASVADLLPSDNADAVLLAICARAEEQDRLLRVADDLHDAIRQERGRCPAAEVARKQSSIHFNAFVDLAEQASVIPAHTVAGMRAKARIVFLNMDTQLQPGELTWHILRDLGWEA